MITCHIRYIINPTKLKAFQYYARIWINLVQKFGGTHHGYFLPSEGASNVALAMFSFPSFAAYEEYRTRAQQHPECQGAINFADDEECILSYERTFFSPVFE